MIDTCPLPALPFAQPGLLDLPPVVGELRARCPVTRVRTRAGDEAWLVTRHAELKQLLADPGWAARTQAVTLPEAARAALVLPLPLPA